MRTKAELLNELKVLLRDVFVARTRGESHSRLARAQGYVDGYMRVLLDSGAVTQKELLSFVAQERREIDGPALREIEAESSEAAA